MEQILSPCSKLAVKRNLSDSFNNNASSLPILSYSIDTSEDDNSFVIKLRKSTRSTLNRQRTLEEKVLNHINREYGDGGSDSESNYSSSLSDADSSNGKSAPRRQQEAKTHNIGNPIVILDQMDIQEIVNGENRTDAKNNFGNRLCSPKKNTAEKGPFPNGEPKSVTPHKSNSIPKYFKGSQTNSGNEFSKTFTNSSSTKSINDTEKLFKETLSISSNWSPRVHLENLELGVRKSNRIRKEVSYQEYAYDAKTPSKRNRKRSTDSNSSSVTISTPRKKRSPQKHKQEISTEGLSNLPPRNIQTRNSIKNHNETPRKSIKFNINSNYSPNKISTPLKDIQCNTPVTDRPRRNINTPTRYRVFSSSEDGETSPKKRTKSDKQNRYNDEGLIKKFEKIHVGDDKETSTPQSATKRHLYIDLVNCDIQNINESSTPTKKDHNIKNFRTPKSAVKNTPTAKARLVRDGIITPSVQMRATPIKKDSTPLNKARTKLHVSYVPKKLVCREKEYDNIFNFLEGKLLDGCGGCMYVSGVPGTGKTATVTDTIRKLEEKSKEGTLPNFQFVSINGMKLSEPRQSYVEILKQLTGKSAAWEQAQSTLDILFTRPEKKSTPIILLVDELDILCTRRQDVVYNLLDWPTRASTQLIVVTIANTMDLPERLLMGRVTSRLGLTRLTFQAYTHKQLQEIVTLRLMGTKVFNPDAVQLVARKVASVSGDARRALDICRRAAEIAELEGPNTLVSMSHVNKALDAMITQPKVKAIKDCSRLQQLILQSVVAEVERTGVEETTFSDVYRMFESVAAIDGFQKVSYTLVLAAVSRLGACRLLLTDQKSNDFHQKIILNVSADDVYYALRDD